MQQYRTPTGVSPKALLVEDPGFHCLSARSIVYVLRVKSTNRQINTSVTTNINSEGTSVRTVSEIQL